MFICEKCGEEFEQDWRVNKQTKVRFCSRACSNSKVHTKEIKEKISLSLFSYHGTEKRFCSFCKKLLNWRNKSGVCFSCKNPAKTRYENIKTFRHKRKKELVEYKGGKCKKCGYKKCIAALDFHHRDPKNKEFTIGAKRGFHIRDLDADKKEVDKCDLLCSNCHREVHFELSNAGVSPRSDKA